jgi:hypothetical protein
MQSETGIVEKETFYGQCPTSVSYYGLYIAPVSHPCHITIIIIDHSSSSRPVPSSS